MNNKFLLMYLFSFSFPPQINNSNLALVLVECVRGFVRMDERDKIKYESTYLALSNALCL